MSEIDLPSVFAVADYLIAANYAMTGTLDDDLMTHLKLQKLVYFAQGASLHYSGVPLFSEPLEAWEHGPVCPILYRYYKDAGRLPIPVLKPLEVARTYFTEAQVDVLDTAVLLFGGYSAKSLRQMSHLDPAWINARKRGDQAIELDDVKRSFHDHVKIGEPIPVETSDADMERINRLCDELGLPERWDAADD
jgi:uncharacterized phage-associated protein